MRNTRTERMTWFRMLLSAALVAGMLTTVACDRLQAGGSDGDSAAEKTAERDKPRIVERLFEPRVIEKQVPAGTELDIRLTTEVSSSSSVSGEPVQGRIEQNVLVDGRIVIPAGSTLTGRVTEARALRKVGGRSSLAFQFDTLTLPDGRDFGIHAAFARTGRSETAKDAATIAGSTIIGAIVGHQFDEDGEGRAVGAVAGAGVGTAIAARTEGETIVLPAGTILRLTLQGPIFIEIEDRA